MKHDAITNDAGGVWAKLWRGNALEEAPPAGEHATPTLVWTGWADAGEPEREVFEPGFVWQGSVWDRLGEHLDGANAIIRPHARHVVGDVNALRAWQGARERAGLDQASAGHTGVVLEPAALFTPAMVAEADTHLDRIALGAGNVRMIRAVVASNATPVSCAWGEELAPAGLGAGVLPAELVAACCVTIAAAHGVPVVLRDGAFEADRSLVLGVAGRYSESTHAGGLPAGPGSPHA